LTCFLSWIIFST